MTMTIAEARIMRAIVTADRALTCREIHLKAGVSETTSRDLPKGLVAQGLLEQRRNAYALTQLGNTWAKSKRGQGLMNVPGLPELARA